MPQPVKRKKISVGIDPGWNNLGLAIVQETDDFKVKVLKVSTEDVSQLPEKFVRSIPETIMASLDGPPPEYEVFSFTVERYVPYANVMTGESENITMVIGMIRQLCYDLNNHLGSGIKLSLLRAIDWKTYLVKVLNKYWGFSNPSFDLDKKFSLAAAKFISINPETITNDHIADAVCLAALPLIGARIKSIEQEKQTQTKAI